MNSGAVDTLLMVGGNPVYNAPADFKFAESLLKVKQRVHLSLYEDETAELCHWHIPETHFLETWGDARAYDGTASIIQPLISPLYNGRSPLELFAILLGQPGRTAHEVVRDHWKKQNLTKDFDTDWQVLAGEGRYPQYDSAAEESSLECRVGGTRRPSSRGGQCWRA